ncbi:Phosphatidylethanolamine N-methyltransferase [Trichinella pseudospiralis]
MSISSSIRSAHVQLYACFKIQSILLYHSNTLCISKVIQYAKIRNDYNQRICAVEQTIIGLLPWPRM